MTDDAFNDSRILQSWEGNADPWVRAVRQQAIESRRLVTDRALLETILAHAPASLLDLGCGEGWLARALSEHGIRVLGVDAVPALVEAARRTGGGEFRVLSFEALARGELAVTVDAVVCNFALLGETVVNDVCRAVPELLSPRGVFIVQTLHPLMACADAPYRDGWRAGSWTGFGEDFGEDFGDPAPWYFRTLESWVRLFRDSGLDLLAIREPVHPHTGKPASVIFVARPSPARTTRPGMD